MSEQKAKAGMKFDCIFEETLDFIDINYTHLNKTVRYEQRPRGEWIDETNDALRCSVCGKWVYKPFIGGFPTERTLHYSPNYCAFCGADMKNEMMRRVKKP